MSWSLFEKYLSSPAEDLEFSPRDHVPWADFFLNPRRLRGSDFLMRWSQGVWSEQKVIEGVNATDEFYALAYGPSGVAPEGVREFELYFERLEQAGLTQVKRPDILIYRKSDEANINDMVEELGGQSELPFSSEENPLMKGLISKALIAVECENSLWRARQMPQYGAELRPMKRLGGRLGLAKSAVLPTVILKEEDRERLFTWQTEAGVDIHIWHIFYDTSFGLSLNRSQSLIDDGLIEATEQIFQAPGGATSRKAIYKFYYHYTYALGDMTEEPELVADSVTDPNGHILPFVRFEGGKLVIGEDTLRLLRGL